MSISVQSSTQYAPEAISAKSEKGTEVPGEKGSSVSSNFASGAVVVNVKSIEEQDRDFLEEWSKFVIDPINKANSALGTVSGALKKLEGEIKTVNPQILTKKWDFVLSDGKIAVTGLDGSPSDKNFIESWLNKNTDLVKSVKDYYGAVSTYYENTSEHTSAVSIQSSSGGGGGASAYFSGVSSQINGRLPVMEMMRNMFTYSDDASSLLDISSHAEANKPSSSIPYESAIYNAATYLTASSKAQFTYSNIAGVK